MPCQTAVLSRCSARSSTSTRMISPLHSFRYRSIALFRFVLAMAPALWIVGASPSAGTSRPPTIVLNDGREMPILGLGVLRTGYSTYDSVISALKMGYRHIDTAQMYLNEAGVGRAVRASGIPREEIWITTKLSTVFDGPVTFAETLNTLRSSLSKLNMSYVDNYLIHSPKDKANRIDQWRALIYAKEIGLTRSIGVSDYTVESLAEIVDLAVPAVLQIEINPWLASVRTAELAFCKEHNIVVEAWGVIAPATSFGSNSEEPALIEVAAHQPGSTVFGVLLMWSLQMGLAPLITSSNPEHQAANLEVARSWGAGASLSDAEMTTLRALAARPAFELGKDMSGGVGPWDPSFGGQ